MGIDTTHDFLIKISKKKELQQIASKHSSEIEFKDFMKFRKDYTEEPYSFLVIDTSLSLDNPLRSKKNLLLISNTIKAINNKIEQNKAKYN